MSWVQIPLQAWISVFISVFVLSCVYVAALRRADLPSKESYQLSTRLIISELILNGNRQNSLIRQGGKRRCKHPVYGQTIYKPMYEILRII
jgi:hypothetical protein